MAKDSIAELTASEKKAFTEAQEDILLAAYTTSRRTTKNGKDGKHALLFDHRNVLATNSAKQVIKRLLRGAALDKALAELSKSLSVFGSGEQERKRWKARASIRSSAARSIGSKESRATVDNKGKK